MHNTIPPPPPRFLQPCIRSQNIGVIPYSVIRSGASGANLISWEKNSIFLVQDSLEIFSDFGRVRLRSPESYFSSKIIICFSFFEAIISHKRRKLEK